MKKAQTRALSFLLTLSLLLGLLSSTGALLTSAAENVLIVQDFENGTNGFSAWMVDGNATWGSETAAPLAGKTSLRLSTANAAGCYVSFPATIGVKDIALRLKVTGNNGIVRVVANGEGTHAHDAGAFQELTTTQFVFTDVNGTVLENVATYDGPWGGLRFGANFDGYVFIKNENNVDIQKINVGIFHGSTNAEGMTLLFDDFVTYSGTDYAGIVEEIAGPTPELPPEAPSDVPAVVKQNFENGTSGFSAWMVDGNASWGLDATTPLSGANSLKLSTANAAGCYVTFPAAIGVKNIALRLKVTGNVGIVRIGANGNDAHNADGYSQLTTSQFAFTDVKGNVLFDAASYDEPWGGIRFNADFDGYVFIQNENAVDIQKINLAIFHGSTNGNGMTLLFDDVLVYSDHTPANFVAVAAQLNHVPACAHEYFDDCDPVCLLCGELREVSHNVIHVEAKAPTCTENGNVEYWYCDKCGAAWLNEAGTQITNLRNVIAPAYHSGNMEYTAAAEAIDCQNPGNIEYWYCPGCCEYFSDAYAENILNPWFIEITVDCVRPEDAADCAVVPCEVCGENTYGPGEHDVFACQGGVCGKCGDYVEGYGCANYDTPACMDGVCYYCGGFVAGFGHENGAWAACCEGECSYGCGLTYPATEEHVDEDADDYCDNCWNHLNHDVDPCVGGECSICWAMVKGAHTYDNGCDVDCNLCGKTREVEHSVEHVEAKAPTCYENGNIEYWYCADCGQAWLDAECTLNTNLKAVITPAVDGFVVKGNRTFYYENGAALKGLALIDGSYYFFSTGDGNMKKDCDIFVSANDLGLARGSYKVAADGKIETVKNGFVVSGDRTFYYVNNEKVTGLQKIDGSYYFFSTGDGNMKKDCDIFVSANDLGLARGSYKVAADGKIVTEKEGWVYAADGRIFYYENGEAVKGFKLIDGNAYYFSTGDGNMKKDGAVIWAPAGNAAELERGQYIAGENGVLALA